MAKENLDIVVSVRDRATASLNGMKTSVEKLGKSVKIVSKDAAKLGRSLGVFGAAVTGTLGLAVKEAADFELGMSRVGAITNATANDMKSMTGLAKELGRTTVFTAEESAEAMKFLGMAGFSTEEILSSTADTMDLAAAGAVDLGKAADISSNVLKGFRLEADDMNRVVDVMAKTVTSSNTDISEMGEAMKYMAPIASNLGISIEESSAAVGFLANAGLKGATATAVLSTSMQKLADPTNKMMEGMAAVGLQTFNEKGEFVGLAGVLEQLEDGMDGFTQKQKSAALSQIFGVRAAKQFSILLEEGSDKLRDYTRELENSGGAADRMAKVQLDNLHGSITLLESAASGLAVGIGGVLAPAIRDLATAMTEITGNVTAWAEEHPELAAAIVKVTAVVGLLALALAPIMLMLPGIVTSVGLLGKALGFLAANPIILLIAAFVALGFLLHKIFVTDWEQTRDTFLFLWGGIVNIVDKSVEKIKLIMNKIVGPVGDAMLTAGEAWKNVIGEALGAIDSDTRRFGSMWMSTWSYVFATVLGALGTDLASLGEVFEDWGRSASDAVSEALDGIGIIMDEAGQSWNTYWSEALDGIEIMTRPALKRIGNAVSEGMDGLRIILDEKYPEIGELWRKFWEGLSDLMDGPIDVVKNKVSGLVSWLGDQVLRIVRLVDRLAERGGYAGSGLSGALGIEQRAEGGPVDGGRPYLVGERGPELFIPSGGGGSVVPNHRLSGGMTVVNNFYIDGDVSGEDLIEKVREALVMELKMTTTVT